MIDLRLRHLKLTNKYSKYSILQKYDISRKIITENCDQITRYLDWTLRPYKMPLISFRSLSISWTFMNRFYMSFQIAIISKCFVTLATFILFQTFMNTFYVFLHFAICRKFFFTKLTLLFLTFMNTFYVFLFKGGFLKNIANI